ncbi:MAG: YbjN domain-containing protein [Euzebya sp.]
MPRPDEQSVRQDAIAAIQAWVDSQKDLDVRQETDAAWSTVLTGENKRTIGMVLGVGDQTLIVESHFMRAPDENADLLYRLLLTRNQRTYLLRFCVYDSGDIMIVGVVPLRAVTAGEMDRIAGALLNIADETYNAALRLGFAGYIEREQAWRHSAGLGRNPIS